MKETLESLKDNVRVGVLGLNMSQEAAKDLRVSVEEENLNPELLSHLLPGPALLAAQAIVIATVAAHAAAHAGAHVREGGVEQEGGHA